MSEVFDKLVKPYVEGLCKEQESLVARFINRYGLEPSQVCIVERETENGRVYYPDLKSKYVSEPPPTERE